MNMGRIRFWVMDIHNTLGDEGLYVMMRICSVGNLEYDMIEPLSVTRSRVACRCPY